jgi:hypothetical protein
MIRCAVTVSRRQDNLGAAHTTFDGVLRSSIRGV